MVGTPKLSVHLESWRIKTDIGDQVPGGYLVQRNGTKGQKLVKDQPESVGLLAVNTN